MENCLPHAIEEIDQDETSKADVEKTSRCIRDLHIKNSIVFDRDLREIFALMTTPETQILLCNSILNTAWVNNKFSKRGPSIHNSKYKSLAQAVHTR